MAPGLDTTLMLNLLQPEFGERVHSYQNERVHVYNRFTIAPRRFDGKNTIEAIVGATPGSFGFFGASMPSIPKPGTFTTDVTTITHAYCAASISVDWDLLAEANGPESFAEVWSLSMERMNKGMLLSLERITCSDGTGVLNRLKTGVSGTVSTLGGINNTTTSGTGKGTATAGTAITGVTAANWQFTVHLWDGPLIEPNSRVDFVTGTWSQAAWRNATKRDTPSQGFYTVANVVPDNATKTALVTIKEGSPGSNSPQYGDFITIHDAIAFAATPSGTNAINEMLGIDAHVTNTALWLQPSTKAGYTSEDTHQNVSPTTNGRWIAPIVDAGTNTQYLNQPLLEELSVQMNVFGSNAADEGHFYLVHPFQGRKYREELYPQERYVVSNETPSLPTGTPASNSEQRYQMFSDLPMITSRYCRPDKAYLLNMNYIKRYQLMPFQFHGVHQDFNGRPANQQDGMGIMQLGTDCRPSSGAIVDLAYV